MDSLAAWPALLGALIRGETLTSDETGWAMNEIMEGAASPAQIAGFAVALRMKGETAGEVAGLAQVMLDRATPISLPGPHVDLVGRGRGHQPPDRAARPGRGAGRADAAAGRRGRPRPGLRPPPPGPRTPLASRRAGLPCPFTRCHPPEGASWIQWPPGPR